MKNAADEALRKALLEDDADQHFYHVRIETLPLNASMIEELEDLLGETKPLALVVGEDTFEHEWLRLDLIHALEELWYVRALVYLGRESVQDRVRSIVNNGEVLFACSDEVEALGEWMDRVFELLQLPPVLFISDDSSLYFFLGMEISKEERAHREQVASERLGFPVTSQTLVVDIARELKRLHLGVANDPSVVKH